MNLEPSFLRASPSPTFFLRGACYWQPAPYGPGDTNLSEYSDFTRRVFNFYFPIFYLIPKNDVRGWTGVSSLGFSFFSVVRRFSCRFAFFLTTDRFFWFSFSISFCADSFEARMAGFFSLARYFYVPLFTLLLDLPRLADIAAFLRLLFLSGRLSPLTFFFCICPVALQVAFCCADFRAEYSSPLLDPPLEGGYSPQTNFLTPEPALTLSFLFFGETVDPLPDTSPPPFY